MKKIILGLGSVAAVVAPIVTVISCGSNEETKKAGEKLVEIAKSFTLSSAPEIAITSTDPSYDGDTWSFTVPTYNMEKFNLQYSIDNEQTWEKATSGGIFSDIAYDAIVKFRWETMAPYVFKEGYQPTSPTPITKDSSILGVATPSNPTITPTEPSYDGDTWSFTSGLYQAPHSILQYQINDGTWFDLLPSGERVENIADGATIKFQWIFEDDVNSIWIDGHGPTPPSPIKKDSTIIGVDTPEKIVINSTPPTHSGATWNFMIPNYSVSGAILQYQIDDGQWQDATSGDTISDIPDGATAHFQWSLDDGKVWKSIIPPSAPTDIHYNSTLIPVDAPSSNPTITPTEPSYDGDTWSFVISNYSTPNAKLQYKIDDNEWKDALSGSRISSITDGATVKFRWALEPGHVWRSGHEPLAPLPVKKDSIILGVATPSNPTITPTEPSYDGDTWSFTSGLYEAPHSILQYQINDGTWFDLLPSGERVENIADGATIKFQWIFEDDVNSIWIDGHGPTPPSPIKKDSTIAMPIPTASSTTKTEVSIITNPIITKTDPTDGGDTWTFTVGSYNSTNVKLEYQFFIGADRSEWKEVPTNSPVETDDDVSVCFRWVLRNPETTVWKDGHVPDAPKNISPFPSIVKIDTPPLPIITTQNANGYWTFNVSLTSVPGAVLKKQVDNGWWQNVKAIGNAADYGSTVIFKWFLIHEWNVWKDPSAISAVTPTVTEPEH